MRTRFSMFIAGAGALGFLGLSASSRDTSRGAQTPDAEGNPVAADASSGNPCDAFVPVTIDAAIAADAGLPVAPGDAGVPADAVLPKAPPAVYTTTNGAAGNAVV